MAILDSHLHIITANMTLRIRELTRFESQPAFHDV